jgi:hypothetical protein
MDAEEALTALIGDSTRLGEFGKWLTQEAPDDVGALELVLLSGQLQSREPGEAEKYAVQLGSHYLGQTLAPDEAVARIRAEADVALSFLASHSFARFSSTEGGGSVGGAGYSGSTTPSRLRGQDKESAPKGKQPAANVSPTSSPQRLSRGGVARGKSAGSASSPAATPGQLRRGSAASPSSAAAAAPPSAAAAAAQASDAPARVAATEAEVALLQGLAQPAWLSVYGRWLTQEAPDEVSALEMVVLSNQLRSMNQADAEDMGAQLCQRYLNSQATGSAAVALVMEQASNAFSFLASNSFPRFMAAGGGSLGEGDATETPQPSGEPERPAATAGASGSATPQKHRAPSQNAGPDRGASSSNAPSAERKRNSSKASTSASPAKGSPRRPMSGDGRGRLSQQLARSPGALRPPSPEHYSGDGSPGRFRARDESNHHGEIEI